MLTYIGDRVIDEIRRLAQKYPEGYVDDKDVSLPD
jgi:hypothetical protein